MSFYAFLSSFLSVLKIYVLFYKYLLVRRGQSEADQFLQEGAQEGGGAGRVPAGDGVIFREELKVGMYTLRTPHHTPVPVATCKAG